MAKTEAEMKLRAMSAVLLAAHAARLWREHCARKRGPYSKPVGKMALVLCDGAMPVRSGHSGCCEVLTK